MTETCEFSSSFLLKPEAEATFLVRTRNLLCRHYVVIEENRRDEKNQTRNTSPLGTIPFWEVPRELKITLGELHWANRQFTSSWKEFDLVKKAFILFFRTTKVYGKNAIFRYPAYSIVEGIIQGVNFRRSRWEIKKVGHFANIPHK